MTEERTKIKLIVNGTEHEVEITPDTKLSDVLRYQLGLTGTKIGCSDGLCGSCTVLLDGRAVRSCTWPARRAAGKEVLTVEGLASTWDGVPLHPLQTAFIDHGAVQCGFCTPGLLMAAAAVWQKMVDSGEEPGEAEIKKALARNACRCTGYASILRAVQSAVHEYRTGRPLPPLPIETMEPLRVIGHSYPRPDAVDKVTGAAKFTDDYTFPGMLHGATLRAAYPHARIVSIDTSRARALPGVHAVLTHKDVPGRNRHGLVYHDWPVLCDDKVRYLGDAVAVVAADTLEIARQALDLIEVDYEPLPTVASAEDARAPHAPHVHEVRAPGADHGEGNLLEHIKVRHGDVEQGFAEADVVVEREYRTPAYDHFFMEPECSIGVPAGYDDAHQKVTVYVGSQIPYADRAQTAAALGLPDDQVRIVGTLIGGGFGGKEDIMGQIHAALLAQATGRPVKILYDRAESLLAHPKRHATVIRIKTGAKRDGTLTAVEAELVGDAGAYASLSTKVLTRATTHATGPYQVPNAKIDCYAMYTNNPPAGAFRGFGVTQSAFAVESNMDILAEALGIDPFTLRRINALRPGSTTATGQLLTESAGLLDCIDRVERRVKELDAGPIPDTRFPAPKIAWGFACAYKNTGLGGGADDAAAAEIELYRDGAATGVDVEVRASSADLGQGLATIVAQCAAEELGLPMERVRVLLSDTDRTPDGGPTTASRQTYVTGNAARHAAATLRERLARVAAEQWDMPPETIRFEHGEMRADGHAAPLSQAVEWLEAEGQAPRLTYRYAAPRTQPLGTGGDMHFAFGFGAQAAQVAVDPESGKVQVLRVVAAADGGRALNPLAFRGQIEGGIVMGIGTALGEEYVLENGVPQTRRWKDYQAPGIGDVPEMEVHLVEHPTADGPYGAKGIGELPSIPTAPAICNAIYRATGVRVYELPVKLGER
ncbi:MAG TPA: molybdopterin cofactor-binding domain-containing protein [Anaerolineae bacterium]|nr:molybdopterin cofactor-binding domain-containing protein [Anaerolineae bacterium]